MQLPEGFTAKAVATEPMIRQPLSISFDEKGRMWVLQYLQYPNPAGLKPVKQDQYLRTIWDRVANTVKSSLLMVTKFLYKEDSLFRSLRTCWFLPCRCSVRRNSLVNRM